jgi:hypothetical protein
MVETVEQREKVKQCLRSDFVRDRVKMDNE